MSRQPLGFVKERKTRIAGLKKYLTLKVGVFHKVPNPLTGNGWVISKLCPSDNFRQRLFNQNNFHLCLNTPQGKMNERICLGTLAQGDNHT